MQRRFINIMAKVGLPVLGGQFLVDWESRGFGGALGHLPVRAAMLFSLLLAWVAFREHRERKKRTFR